MIILSILKDEQHIGTRGRGAGNQIRKQTALGVDKYNVLWAVKSNNTPFQGKAFAGRLVHLVKSMVDFDIDVEDARKRITHALCYVFGKEYRDYTFEELDQLFAIPQRKKGSSGELTMYNRLKDWYHKSKGAATVATEEVIVADGTSEEDDEVDDIKGDIIIEIPDMETVA